MQWLIQNVYINWECDVLQISIKKGVRFWSETTTYKSWDSFTSRCGGLKLVTVINPNQQ